MESVDSAGKLHLDMAEIQQKMARNGNLRHIGRIARFLDVLATYSATVEVFIQVKPKVLALAWGPVKLLLVWSSEYGQLFDTIAGTMERVGHIVPQFQAPESTSSDRAELGEAMHPVSGASDQIGSYIVVDGIDEMDEKKRTKLLRQLQDIAKTCSSLRLMVSSRNEHDIAATPEKRQTLPICVSSRNENSIALYVKHHVDKWLSSRGVTGSDEVEVRQLLQNLHC